MSYLEIVRRLELNQDTCPQRDRLGRVLERSQPCFSAGELVTATDNEGRTRVGVVCWVFWQEHGTSLMPGWWYWLESKQGGSWTHETRLRPVIRGDG